MKLFLDTNVLIDFIMERPLFYDAAAMIVSYAFEKKVSICVSTLSIVTANFICVERCKMPIDIFRRKIDFLRAFIEVCSVDSSDIYHSYDAGWKDFEESAIKVVSTEEACSLLLFFFLYFENTEDFSSRPATASGWMFCQQVCAGGGVYIK